MLWLLKNQYATNTSTFSITSGAHNLGTLPRSKIPFYRNFPREIPARNRTLPRKKLLCDISSIFIEISGGRLRGCLPFACICNCGQFTCSSSTQFWLETPISQCFWVPYESERRKGEWAIIFSGDQWGRATHSRFWKVSNYYRWLQLNPYIALLVCFRIANSGRNIIS